MHSPAAMLICAAVLAAFVHAAIAGEGVRHDRRVEQAAAQIAAAKIGELRGGHAHDADPKALIETWKRPLRLKQQPLPVPGAVPPLVFNDVDGLDPLVDRILTGSVKLN